MIIFKFNIKPSVYTIKGKEHKIKSGHIDLILSFIINRMIINEDLQNGYVEIPSFSFRKLYDNYWVYISYLIKNEIIERKPYSVQNHICYGYRFCYQFIKELNIEEVIFNDPCERTEDYKEIPFEDQALIDFKLVHRLKSDFHSAEIDTIHNDKVRVEDTAYVDAKKYFYNIIQLHKWKSGNEHNYFEWKSNRLYTNFTFLSSHYRKSNIKLNGESLVEFDISSSFPLMLAIYCIKVNPDIVNDYDFKEYCTSIKQKSFYEDLTVSLNRTKDCDSKKAKTDTYGNQITNRRFTKDIVKKLFQIFLNGDSARTAYVEGYSNSFIREQFQLKYPPVYEIIERVKSNNEQIYYKLSKIESEFIFQIIENLYNEIPGIKILTCHDALYIPLSYKEIGTEVWDMHMKSLLETLPDNIDRFKVDSSFLEELGMYEEDNTSIMKRKSNNRFIDFGDDFDDEEDDFDWFYS